MRKFILPLLAGLAVSAMATSANAATYLFDSVGDSSTIDFNGYGDNGIYGGLSAQISYTLTGITNSGTTYLFDVSVANTSSGATTASRISGFGFNVDPNVASAASVGSTTFGIVSSGNVPVGFGTAEVCFLAGGGGQCAGGGGGGVTLGNTGSGDFSLTFASAPVSGITLDNLFVRYQSISNTDTKGSSGIGTPISAIPEPATWAMMIVGFGMVGASIRRRKSQVAATA